MQCSQVSILTRPEGRVQPHNRSQQNRVTSVSILTRPEGRVQPQRLLHIAHPPVVSILTRPEGRVQRPSLRAERCWHVSILTRPEGRVQQQLAKCLAALTGSFNPHPSRRTGATGGGGKRGKGGVSILTRPEGRVQPSSGICRADCPSSFQSSPVPKDGCNVGSLMGCSSMRRFNPHPSRRTGATHLYADGLFHSRVSILTRPEGRVQPCTTAVRNWWATFQSSPVPKDGCNACPKVSLNAGRRVSILTRPEGRVQRKEKEMNTVYRVSILTRPEGRVQHGERHGKYTASGFNPHPSRRTGATSMRSAAAASFSFQSSPVPKDGCNVSGTLREGTYHVFQSSPVPKDGCNGGIDWLLQPIAGFNPHPSRRTGATGAGYKAL